MSHLAGKHVHLPAMCIVCHQIREETDRIRLEPLAAAIAFRA
jgi:hypothetical protein